MGEDRICLNDGVVGKAIDFHRYEKDTIYIIIKIENNYEKRP
jgi:hypothetical protein